MQSVEIRPSCVSASVGLRLARAAYSVPFGSCGIYRENMAGESHRGFLCLPVVDSVEVAAEIYVAAAVGADEFMGG